MSVSTDTSVEERIERLHAGGIVDMHFDLPMDLYEKRESRNVLETEFLPEFLTVLSAILQYFKCTVDATQLQLAG